MLAAPPPSFGAAAAGQPFSTSAAPDCPCDGTLLASRLSLPMLILKTKQDARGFTPHRLGFRCRHATTTRSTVAPDGPIAIGTTIEDASGAMIGQSLDIYTALWQQGAVVQQPLSTKRPIFAASPQAQCGLTKSLQHCNGSTESSMQSKHCLKGPVSCTMTNFIRFEAACGGNWRQLPVLRLAACEPFRKLCLVMIVDCFHGRQHLVAVCPRSPSLPCLFSGQHLRCPSAPLPQQCADVTIFIA